MEVITSILNQVGSVFATLKATELSISYLYVVIYAFILLLAILFSSKKALIIVGTIMAFYLGVLQGYPYITASLDRQPLLWILYLIIGLVYLLSIGLSMFLDR